MAKRTAAQGPSDPFDHVDDRRFRSALNSAIWNLIPRELDAMDVRSQFLALDRHPRTYMAVDIFNTESTCEGVLHFFYHSCGSLFEFTHAGLIEIGMSEFADRLQGYARELFGETVPLDEGLRQKILEECEEIEERLNQQLFSGYYDDSAEIDRRLATWARQNRAHFPLPANRA